MATPVPVVENVRPVEYFFVPMPYSSRRKLFIVWFLIFCDFARAASCPQIIREAMIHFVGPLGVLMTSVAPPMDEGESPGRKIRRGVRYMVGYSLIALALQVVSRHYFYVPLADYTAQARKRMAAAPKNVLYLHSLAPDNLGFAVPELDFKANFSTHPKAHLVSVRNLDHLGQVLKALPPDRSVDHVEIFVESNAGEIEFADGSQAGDAEIARAFESTKLDFAAPGAEILWLACELRSGTWGEKAKGAAVLQTIGKKLLPRGGTEFSSPKMIDYSDVAPETTPIGQRNAITYASGTIGFFYLFKYILPGAYRDFWNGSEDGIATEIEPAP